MPVSEEELDKSFQRFIPNYGASLPDRAAVERTMVLWAEQLEGQPWVTDSIFQRARNLIIVGHADKYLPPFAVVLDFCHAAKEQLDREDPQRTAPALPSPAYRDDRSTTPDERQRWALEDAEIRPWYAAILRRREEVAYLNERLDRQTLEWQLDIERIEDERGKVPDMAPDARRARDRRNDVAKGGASGTAVVVEQPVVLPTQNVGVWPR